MDAEVIILLNRLLRDFGLTGYTFKINSLGCDSDKAKAKKLLKKELKENQQILCDDCKRRYDSNILRILDCKVAGCKKVIESISLEGFLCDQCDADYKSIQDLLKEAAVEFQLIPSIVRGLDYYTGVVFEVTSKDIGAQDAIAAGGRYDNLVSDLGGDSQGACGFAIGVERVLSAISPASAVLVDRDRKGVFIATIGNSAYMEGFRLLCNLRDAGIESEIDFRQKSLKAQMRYADKISSRYVLMLGDDELKEGVCVLKDMSDSSQSKIKLDEIISVLSTSQ